MFYVVCYSIRMITDDLNLGGVEELGADYEAWMTELQEEHDREEQEAIMAHIREAMVVL